MDRSTNQGAAVARRTLLWVSIPQLISIVLYVLATHTAMLMPNHVLPLWTPYTGLAICLAVFAYAILLALMRMILRWCGTPGDWASAARVFTPLIILLLFPVRVFVMHKLALPSILSMFLTHHILCAIVGILIAAEGLRILACSPMAEPMISSIRRLSPRVLTVALAVTFTGIYITGILRDDRIRQIVGDEPHYLFIMESLKRYGTPDLTRIMQDNDLSNGVRRVKPHITRHSAPGMKCSVHNVGLPLLLIVPHKLLGFQGVMLFFAAIATLIVINIFLLSYEITNQKWASFFAAVLMGASCPFIFYFRCIYPDLVAALALLYGYRTVAVEGKHRDVSKFALAGALCAYLPWLHAKYVLFSATIYVLCAVLNRHNWRRLAAFTVPYIPSALALIWFFHGFYGSWLPNAQYGGDSPTVSLRFLRGGPGLLFDRDHGLLAFSPFYLLALVGLPLLIKNFRNHLIMLGVLLVPSYIVFASHWMWWGGPCPPARFIMPMLPFLVLPLVLVLRFNQRWRKLLIVAVAATFYISLSLYLDPSTLSSHRHMLRNILPLWNAAPGLPLFFIHKSQPMPAVHYLSLTCWLIPIFFAMFDMLREQRTSPQRKDHLAGIIIVSVFLLLPGISAAITASLDTSSEMYPFSKPMSSALFRQCTRMYTSPAKYSHSPFARLRRALSSPVTMHAYTGSTPADGYLGSLHQGDYKFIFNLEVKSSIEQVPVSATVLADNGKKYLGGSEMLLSQSDKPIPLEVKFSVSDENLRDCTYSCGIRDEKSSLAVSSIEMEIILAPLIPYVKEEAP